MSVVWQQTQNGLERGGLARAVGTDEPDDAAFFDTQINAIQRGRGSKLFAQTVRFNACHVSALLFWEIRFGPLCASATQDFSARQPQPLNGSGDPGPFLG